MDNIYKQARDLAATALESVGIRPAKNDRSLKKSDYSTTYTIFNTESTIDDTQATCMYVIDMTLTAVIHLHYGGDYQKLLDTSDDVKCKIIESMRNVQRPAGSAVEIGMPLSFSQLNLTDNTAELECTISVKAYKSK